MYSYKCKIAYEGTRYNGWQKQGNTSNTIQGKLEDMLSRMTSETIEVAGSGRTDAGVHALGQVFHFHCEMPLLEKQSAKELLKNMNHFLPKDIRILSIETCQPRFHARLNATAKTYQYRIDCSPYGNLFLRNTAHHIPEPLNLEAMKKGATLLMGTHDFKSFCSNKRFKKSSIRTIYNITIDRNDKEQLITLTYTGNGFLYNMVRIMSGTLIEVGLGIRNPEDIPNILIGCDRGLAGHTAPPQGLFLISVDYNAQESLS